MNKFMLSIILILVATFLLPYFIEKSTGRNASPSELFMVLGLLFIILAFILWIAFFIRYEFFENYLLVKFGPFHSKIGYEAITKVEAANFTIGDTLAGYRVIGARDGMEIHYKTATLGSIRISPERKEQFLDELKSHAPHAKFIKKED